MVSCLLKFLLEQWSLLKTIQALILTNVATLAWIFVSSFVATNVAEKCANVCLKILSDFTLTNVDTPSRNMVSKKKTIQRFLGLHDVSISSLSSTASTGFIMLPSFEHLKPVFSFRSWVRWLLTFGKKFSPLSCCPRAVSLVTVSVRRLAYKRWLERGVCSGSCWICRYREGTCFIGNYNVLSETAYKWGHLKALHICGSVCVCMCVCVCAWDTGRVV